jgi:hypothetical protein
MRRMPVEQTSCIGSNISGIFLPAISMNWLISSRSNSHRANRSPCSSSGVDSISRLISSVGRNGLTVESVILGIVNGQVVNNGGLRSIAQFTADRRDLKSERMVPWLTVLPLADFPFFRDFFFAVLCLALAVFFLLVVRRADFSFARFCWKVVISASVRLITRTSPSTRMK